MMEGHAAICTVEERSSHKEIVVLNVRWYVSYKLSYRDWVTMMGERGIDLAASHRAVADLKQNGNYRNG